MKSVPSGGPDVVDGDDVGMVQGAGGLGLLHEPALAVGIGDLVGGKDLDRDGALELRVAGLEDDAHAAFAQLRLERIATQGLANHRGRA